MSKPFNVRVYAIILRDEAVLLTTEPFNGGTVIKFPGGGLEFGEEPEDTVCRELREEFGLDAEVREHLYTTGFFVPSALDPDEQLIAIYYRVHLHGDPTAQATHPWHWQPLSTLVPDQLSLPIDRFVVERFLTASPP